MPENLKTLAVMPAIWIVCSTTSFPVKIRVQGENRPVGCREAVRDILDVFVDNASHHAHQGGRVDIVAIHDATKWMADISVCDNGPGVPAAKQDSVFLTPANGSSVNVRTGLGLFIAVRRAVRLGGRSGTIVRRSRCEISRCPVCRALMHKRSMSGGFGVG